MAVNKVRRLGSFAPLSASAWTDDALAEAGEPAELLYYRALSFSAHVLRDGFVTDSQLTRMVGHGMRDAKKRAERLCAVGLWVREDGGFRVRSWLKWNRSKDEIEDLQRKDAGRKAGSKRTPDGDDDPGGSESERNPNGIRVESESGSLFESNGFQPRARHTEPEPHTEPKTKANSSAPDGAESETANVVAIQAGRPAGYPQAFEDAWLAYGRKGAKKTAYAEWQRATKRATVQTISAAIRPYVASTPDPKFRKDFERWLKGDCWESAIVQSRPAADGYQPWTNPDDHDAYDEEIR